jgi:hypothetical protein
VGSYEKATPEERIAFLERELKASKTMHGQARQLACKYHDQIQVLVEGVEMAPHALGCLSGQVMASGTDPTGLTYGRYGCICWKSTILAEYRAVI